MPVKRGLIKIIFYDFEVFKEDWLVVLVNPDEQTETVIVNNQMELTEYYEDNKNDVWVGYNSNHYDQYILKGILCGFNPKKINDFIIEKGKYGWQYSSMFSQIPFLSYDTMVGGNSLKQLEGFFGNKIKESSIPFTIDRKLTDEEITETIEYCKHDVYNTMAVFMKTVDDFNAILSLIKTFNLPMKYISKTKAQLSAIILGCEKIDRDDEFDISIVPTLRMGKYEHIKDWFLDVGNRDYEKSFECEVAGVLHTFGWGGVHGAKEKYHSDGFIIHVDVTSYYPSLMIEYNLLSRNVTKPEKFKEIYDTRVALKQAGKKKEQAPYKIVLNGTYGICKDKMSKAYDPLQANNVCINGQLLLIDLIDKLEEIDGFELIQSNTDGLIVKIPDTDKHFGQLDDICYEWETRTKMGLGFDFVEEIWEKDVNNYIFSFKDKNGNLKYERKGAYVKELSDLDNNLPIVNRAVVDCLTKDIPVEYTINACEDLKQFQMICKISSKYRYLIHGDKPLSEKCVRAFASKCDYDGGLFKLHNNKEKPDKFPSTPLHCFIENDDVTGVEVPDKLDRTFYINMAKDRLKGFGKDV